MWHKVDHRDFVIWDRLYLLLLDLNMKFVGVIVVIKELIRDMNVVWLDSEKGKCVVKGKLGCE